jgi:hypothetical protein
MPRTPVPELSMVWHDSPHDKHPVADVTKGQDKIWQAVDAIVAAGLWDTTVFLLSWDDWGGYDDHVVTPNLEHTPDGVQLAYGPRVPLLMFGGAVKTGIDSRWKRPNLDRQNRPRPARPAATRRAPRDVAPSLADLVDITAKPSAPPPAYGTTITQPTPPSPTPTPTPVPPPPDSAAVGPVILRDGSTLPPPNDHPSPEQARSRTPIPQEPAGLAGTTTQISRGSR